MAAQQGHDHHPDAPATRSSPKWQALNWSFPFAPANGGAADPQTWLSALANSAGGFYPLGSNGMYHGGIHFDAGTGGKLRQDDGVRAIADGEVLAYRLDSTYPELTYPTTPPRFAMYSSGFVLVRHRLVLPPAPKPASVPAGASEAAATATTPAGASGMETPQTYQPPAEDVLEFYSLYMHQLDWKGYQNGASTSGGGGSQTDLPIHPLPFWQGIRRFRVGAKANDRQARAPRRANDSQNADTPQTGARICDRASGSMIGLLPSDSELSVVGNVAKGWAQIATVTKGAPVAVVAGRTPDPKAITGWVNLDGLDATVDPKPRDTIVVLDSPFKVNAGDVVGYLGEYQSSNEASVLPPKRFRPLLHIEVFTGAQLNTFISKSKERAAKLPDSGKTLLVIQQGAKLVKPADSRWNTELAGLTLKLVKSDPGKGCWAKVQPTRIATQTSAHGRGHEHRNARQASATPVGSPLWIERRYAGKVAGTTVRTWADFPLQLASTTGPAVEFQYVLARAQFDQFSAISKATDEQGAQWWAIEAGDRDSGTIRGWVCEKGHPNTKWLSPWAWPGFDTVDTTEIPLIDMYRRNLFEAKQLLDGEETEFSLIAATVNAGQFIGKLEKAAKRQGDGKGNVKPADLRRALTIPWLAGSISHLIFRYESEWGGDMSKWEALSRLMGNGKQVWQTELTRIQKLHWWDKVKAVKGFPASPDVWHIHPIGLLGNFWQGTCSCNKDITEEELDLLLPSDVKSKGLFYAAHDASIHGFDKGKFLAVLNKYMRAADMMTCTRKVHFLSQMSHECDSLKTNEEYRNRDGSIPSGWNNYKGGSNFHGRGLIQLTHDENYIAYAKFVGDAAIGTDPDKVSHSIDHTANSACWYWRHGSRWGDINPKADRNDFYAITVSVNGGFNHVDDRFVILNKLAKLLGADKCTTNPGFIFNDFQIENSSLCGTAFYKNNRQRINSAVEAVNAAKSKI